MLNTKLSSLAHVMLKNDHLKLTYKPAGLHSYPTDNPNLARLHLDLYVPRALAQQIIALISADLLKANGR